MRSKPGTKGWDVDLGHGLAGEGTLLDAVRGRVEVKRDRLAWNTGRVVVEYRNRGKASGISVTTARWWAFVFDGPDGEVQSIVLVPVERLKKLAREAFARGGEQHGGDCGESAFVFVSLAALVTTEVQG